MIVGDEATANYNGLVTSINHRLSCTFSLLANWTWSKCLNIYDAQGDYAGTGPENIAQPRPGLRSMRLRLPAHRECFPGRQEQLQHHFNSFEKRSPMAGNSRRSSAFKAARHLTSPRARTTR